MQSVVMFLGGLVARFTSRKFLLTASAALVLVANNQWNELVILVSTYTGFEGAADIYGKVKDAKTEVAKIDHNTHLVDAGYKPAELDGTRSNVIVPGDDSSTQ